MKHWHKLLFTLAISLMSPMALAHDNTLSSGLLAGLSHPLTGIDHLIALVLAGIFIGRLVSERQMAIASLCFALGLGAMAAILSAGHSLIESAWIEAAILVSIPVFFILQWIRQKTQIKMTLFMMSMFMLAHGWAQGIEIDSVDSTGFSLGFMITSAAVISFSSLLAASLSTRLISTSHG
ncbi:MAG: HupE/UreJ family protein [Gammaproteobacteria bacterium]